jgi:hypothetical protein
MQTTVCWCVNYSSSADSVQGACLIAAPCIEVGCQQKLLEGLRLLTVGCRVPTSSSRHSQGRVEAPSR